MSRWPATRGGEEREVPIRSHELVSTASEPICAHGLIWMQSASGPSCRCFRLRLRRTQTKKSIGEMQTPLETSVQALRNTRPVEKICAWMTAEIPFHPMPLMHGPAPRRRRSSSALGSVRRGRMPQLWKRRATQSAVIRQWVHLYLSPLCRPPFEAALAAPQAGHRQRSKMQWWLQRVGQASYLPRYQGGF
jgi:hypothetical protein